MLDRKTGLVGKNKSAAGRPVRAIAVPGAYGRGRVDHSAPPATDRPACDIRSAPRNPERPPPDTRFPEPTWRSSRGTGGAPGAAPDLRVPGSAAHRRARAPADSRGGPDRPAAGWW